MPATSVKYGCITYHAYAKISIKCSQRSSGQYLHIDGCHLCLQHSLSRISLSSTREIQDLKRYVYWLSLNVLILGNEDPHKRCFKPIVPLKEFCYVIAKYSRIRINVKVVLMCGNLHQ